MSSYIMGTFIGLCFKFGMLRVQIQLVSFSLVTEVGKSN
jgi:hypothetical protein